MSCATALQFLILIGFEINRSNSVTIYSDQQIKCRAGLKEPGYTFNAKLSCDGKPIPGCTEDLNLVDGRTSEIIPVTDVTTNMVYKSVHCAACNGVNVSLVQYWWPSINCDKSLQAENTETLLNSMFRTSGCTFFLLPPNPGLENYWCYLVVDRCNITRGAFREHGTCSRNVYTEFFGKGLLMKEDACPNCTGISEFVSVDKRKPPLKPAYPFSFVLSFKIDSIAETVRKDVCKVGSLMDHRINICIPARCSVLRYLEDGKCKRVTKFVDAFTYKIGIRIKTIEDIHIQELIEHFPALDQLVAVHLLSALGTFVTLQSAIQIFPMANKYDLTKTTDIGTLKVKFIEWNWKISFDSRHDPEEKLDNILNATFNKTLQLSLNSNFNINFIILIGDFKTSYTLLNIPRRCSPFTYHAKKYDITNIFICSIFDLEKSIDNGAVNSLPTVPLWFKQKKIIVENIRSTIQILELKSCPFIEVRNFRGSEWLETDTGLSFTITGFNLTFADFLLGETSDVILVCYDIYTRLTSNTASCNSRFGYEFYAILVLLGKIQT